MSKNLYRAIFYLSVVVLTVSSNTVRSQNELSGNVNAGADKLVGGPDITPPAEAALIIRDRSGRPGRDKPSTIAVSLDRQRQEKQFSGLGVSFFYDQTLADDVSARLIAATPIYDPSGRPDGVLPRHLNIRFNGSYGDRKYYTPYPEINVFPIDAYIKMFRNTDYSEDIGERIQTLRSALSTQPGEFEGEYPYIPFVEATQLVHAHLSYLSFENGRGIGYITQFNHADEVLINNERLVYVYQGITSDGKHLISVEFPLRAPFLPEKPFKGSHLGFTQRTYHNRDEWQALQEDYKRYLPAAEAELRSATEDQFTPNSADIKRLISSLNFSKR